jgi:hypothetical protein
MAWEVEWLVVGLMVGGVMLRRGGIVCCGLVRMIDFFSTTFLEIDTKHVPFLYCFSLGISVFLLYDWQISFTR